MLSIHHIFSYTYTRNFIHAIGKLIPTQEHFIMGAFIILFSIIQCVIIILVLKQIEQMAIRIHFEHALHDDKGARNRGQLKKANHIYVKTLCTTSIWTILVAGYGCCFYLPSFIATISTMVNMIIAKRHWSQT